MIRKSLGLITAFGLSSFSVVFANPAVGGSPVREARTLTLNQMTVEGAPSWLTEARTQRVVERIESKLEWDIRKIRVIFYRDRESFLKEFGVKDAAISAFARKKDMSVHMGPGVDSNDFDGVFGHELSHVISYQKYKEAIPQWLEEGLANLVSRNGKPNYSWLAQQSALPVVKQMGHPFQAVSQGKGSPDSVRLHYEASHALAELLKTKCGLHDLLQLSTGSSVEKYIATLCGIRDIDAALRDWVSRKSQSGKEVKNVTSP